MPGPTLTISCSECAVRDAGVCDDCIVTFICEHDPDQALVIDADEERAVRLLSSVGLAPALRYPRRAG